MILQTFNKRTYIYIYIQSIYERDWLSKCKTIYGTNEQDLFSITEKWKTKNKMKFFFQNIVIKNISKLICWNKHAQFIELQKFIIIRIRRFIMPQSILQKKNNSFSKFYYWIIVDISLHVFFLQTVKVENTFHGKMINGPKTILV